MKFIKLTIIWIVFWAGMGLLGWSGVNLYKEYRGGLQAKFKEAQQVLAKKEQTVNGSWMVEDRVPTEISIPKIKLDVEIVPGQIVDGDWQIAETKANYLVGSGVMGRSGNLVVYAHKRPKLFADLSQLKIGDTVKLASKEVVAEYMVTETRVVEADAVDVLEDSSLKELTLYTCDGWRDVNRFVVKALFVKEEANGFAGLLGEEVPEKGFGRVIDNQ